LVNREQLLSEDFDDAVQGGFIVAFKAHDQKGRSIGRANQTKAIFKINAQAVLLMIMITPCFL
jgi:hypothetical protein